MKIEVTQFMRPNGRLQLLNVEIPDEYKDQYELTCNKGCKITCEQLMTGQAAQYISHKLGDFDIKITSGSEATHKALLKMIKDFDEAEFDKWLAQEEAALV